MFSLTVAVVFLLSCCLATIPVATAVPVDKAPNPRILRHCSVPNTVALTFDDGPYKYMKEVVDMLKAVNAKGTFFLNGKNWDCIYDDAMVQKVKYAYDNGFQIASHTWSHKNLTQLNPQQVDSEMSRTEDAIRKITGAIPAFTRPPFGAIKDETVAVADSRHQTLVNWDFDSQDALKASPDAQKKSYDDVVRSHPTNLISLEHEVFDNSVHTVLPYAIKVLQAAGYKLVTLAECLNTQPYLTTGPPSNRDDTWTCK